MCYVLQLGLCEFTVKENNIWTYVSTFSSFLAFHVLKITLWLCSYCIYCKRLPLTRMSRGRIYHNKCMVDCVSAVVSFCWIGDHFFLCYCLISASRFVFFVTLKASINATLIRATLNFATLIFANLVEIRKN